MAQEGVVGTFQVTAGVFYFLKIGEKNVHSCSRRVCVVL